MQRPDCVTPDPALLIDDLELGLDEALTRNREPRDWISVVRDLDIEDGSRYK